ncbi:AI-2E family transporter [Pontibacter diazotrophicus]|uniref:AI-2E family transporter n=1 Tax=Pontibacter diazotrophicus TaxID=1400979 RepID=A0A3D8LAR6_9BACT|nr:AI-2E family transporter [Pontibacter diazotrophicus]RDV14495.1 AI-2E family transporter [Pontibacter diazotrophicus]
MSTKKNTFNRLLKILLLVLLVSLILYLGKTFLIPIAIAIFFAMLLFPLVQKLQGFRLKRPAAALVSILVLLAILGALGTLVYYQVTILEDDLPRLEKRIEEKTNRLQGLLYQTTDLTQTEQDQIVEEQKGNIARALFKSVRDFIMQGLYILLFIFIVLTYTFFLIVYQQRIQNFFVRLRLFGSERETKVMFGRISRIIHDYLIGVLTVISILGVVYALGFWAIGIEHAILFAMVTALLRIIPYFGSFLGIALPITFAFLVKDSLLYPALVLLFFMVTQVVEANLLTPYITGSKVKLNPLATIMIILLGNLLWGVPGMILFVPLFASLKVVFDRVPRLNPYGYILGKEEDSETS